MDVLYLDSQRYGYDSVQIQSDGNIIYHGRCGTIPLKVESEFIDITLKVSRYENEKQNKESQRFFVLLTMMLVGLFTGGSDIQGLGRPYYYVIRMKRQLFMQLEFDDLFTHYFKSNVEIQQKRIKDKDYVLFWLFSYIIPLEIITLIFALLSFLTLSTTILSILFGVIAIFVQLFVLYRLYEELK